MTTVPVCHFKFDHQPGYFVDHVELAKSSPDGKITTQPSFGIIDQTFSDDTSSTDKSALPWERLLTELTRLNEQSPAEVSYKLLFLTRHGFGVHNEAEARFGTKAWDDYWGKLEGDGTVVWADAHLVEKGIQQVTELGLLWKTAVGEQKVPVPGTLYTSPLTRCLQTTRLVFGGVVGDGARSTFDDLSRPIIKENLRERMTDHTCDRRSLRTWIADSYPDYLIEAGFAERDELWRADRWEPFEEHVARKQAVLEDIFATDENHVVSLTVHTMAIVAILDAVGAPHFRVREGTTVPLVVKATRIDAS